MKRQEHEEEEDREFVGAIVCEETCRERMKSGEDGEQKQRTETNGERQ